MAAKGGNRKPRAPRTKQTAEEVAEQRAAENPPQVVGPEDVQAFIQAQQSGTWLGAPLPALQQLLARLEQQRDTLIPMLSAVGEAITLINSFQRVEPVTQEEQQG